MPKIAQAAFSAGELAPSLWARVDLGKYHSGAKTLRNMFVHAHGGASNRPGTIFVGRVKDTTHPVRLIPFTFNQVQAYILEFGHLYMRVVMNGGHVLEPSFSVTGVSLTNPCVVQVSGHNFAAGDEIYLTGILGPTQLDNKRFKVAGVSGANVTLNTLDGAAVDATGFAAYVSGGFAARVFTLVTPYAGSDLATLKWTQSADTMTLCHPGYAPRDLTRTQHWAWALSTITFAAKIATPTGVSATPNAGTGSGASIGYLYSITAAVDSPAEESQRTSAVSVANYPLNPNTGTTNTISWSAVTGASRYRVYKSLTGNALGYIGTTTDTSFTDTNIAPDFSQAPPDHQNPFASGNNPSCVTYYEQRRVFGGTVNNPSGLYMSKPGNYANMDTSFPTRDDDAITITIASQKVDAIKHLLPMNALLPLTAGGAWKVSAGSQSDVLTPTSTVVRPQAYNGCSDVPPIIVNFDILYVQAKGSIVRDLSYNFYADVFTGNDMSVLANHLFFGHQIVDWAYAEEPFKLVWAVREDGVILCFTYLKEQEIYAWTRGDTSGTFKAVASVSEGNENAVYFVVTRTVPGVNGGQPVQYIERLATRNFHGDVTQAWFVDCGASYSGTATATLSGLDHLEGLSVTILADGNVVAPQTVTGGQVTLPVAASTIIAGLPYTAQLQTLSLDMPDPTGGTVQGKRKKISGITMRLENSRGLKYGPRADRLREIKERNAGNMGAAIPLTTGDEQANFDPLWQEDGSFWLQQDNPLPCTILGVFPNITMGDSFAG